MPTYLSRMRRIRRFSWSVDSTMPGTTCRGSGRLPWRAIWQLKTATWRLQELRRGVTIVRVSQLHSIRSCFSLIITTKTATALQFTLFNFRKKFSYSRDSESEPFGWKKICESWTPLLTSWVYLVPFIVLCPIADSISRIGSTLEMSKWRITRATGSILCFSRRFCVWVGFILNWKFLKSTSKLL